MVGAYQGEVGCGWGQMKGRWGGVEGISRGGGVGWGWGQMKGRWGGVEGISRGGGVGWGWGQMKGGGVGLRAYLGEVGWGGVGGK